MHGYVYELPFGKRGKKNLERNDFVVVRRTVTTKKRIAENMTKKTGTTTMSMVE